MAKKIIREMIIMLLLCIAIILLLGVLLYTYAPGNRTMPEKVSYTMPAEVKKELDAAALAENDQVILTYEVNSNDLTNYQKVKNYNPGKPNPFSSIEKEETNETQTSGTGNTNTTTSSNKTTNTGNSTGGNSTNNTGSTVAQNTTTTKSSTTVENNETSKYSHDKGTK